MSKVITIVDLMKEKKSDICDAWIELIDKETGATRRTDMLMSKSALRSDVESLINSLILAFASENYDDLNAPQFEPLLSQLHAISTTRARQGFTPTETAMFVMSFKSALFPFIQETFKTDVIHLNKEVAKINGIIDRLAMVTFESYALTREEVIAEQSNSLLEASTPVIKLWDSIVLLPLVGIIDTPRSQHIIANLLKGIVDYQAQVAVLDVTGVPMMDTRVAHHLINTVDAARMLGSEVILTGISADTAQTLVRLNVDLSGLRTSGSLQNGIRDAMTIIGKEIIDKAASS